MRRFVYYGASSTAASLLLDTYPATAAYSLRKLRTAYAGSAIRVRRSSDNAEQDIGFSAGVLDTSALTTFVGAGNGFVVTWYDQSGAGANVTRPVLSQQPLIVSSGVVLIKGTKPSIDFDGSDDRLVLGSALSALDSGNQFSIFSVSSSDLLNTLRSLWSNAGSGSSNQMRGVADTRNIASPLNFFVSNSASVGFSSTLSTTRNNTDQRLQISVMDAGNVMRGFDNGATGGTNTYTLTYANTELVIGAGANGALNGTVQEFIVFDTNQLSNRTTIETNINDYYAIY